MTSMLWHSAQLHSSEHCSLSGTSEGHRLAGTVVIPLDRRPGHIRYAVEVDAAWRTRLVEVSVHDDGLGRRFLLAADGEGSWLIDRQPAPHLDGCLDVDLGWSPATNTLPIRRLGLAVGASASITAAWVRFPQFEIEPSLQSYRRIDERRWVYSSGSFEATLEVDPEGLVLLYGEGIWRTVAHSSVPPSGH